MVLFNSFSIEQISFDVWLYDFQGLFHFVYKLAFNNLIFCHSHLYMGLYLYTVECSYPPVSIHILYCKICYFFIARHVRLGKKL